MSSQRPSCRKSTPLVISRVFAVVFSRTHVRIRCPVLQVPLPEVYNKTAEINGFTVLLLVDNMDCVLSCMSACKTFFIVYFHFLKGKLGFHGGLQIPLTRLYSENAQNPCRCSYTGFGQLSSFLIVCVIPIVSLCIGWSRLISFYSLVQMPAGLPQQCSIAEHFSRTAWV
jgi:hypothetical protein